MILAELLSLLPVGPASRIVVGSLPEKRPDLGPCWMWTGAVGAGGQGYGLLTFKQQVHRVHVFTYTAAVEPVPAGLELDHLCEHTLCVRPSHLEPVTHAENIRRHYAGMTHCKHGHRRDEANTYINPNNGRRDCRGCNREKQRARRLRLKGIAA